MNRILQIIFLSSLVNAYPDMQNIPPEVLEKMPPEMREKAEKSYIKTLKMMSIF